MWETIRGYLTFTRKERYGVLFLFIIIIILFVLPYFLKTPAGKKDPSAYDKLKEDVQKFEAREADSSADANTDERYHDRKTFVPVDDSVKRDKRILATLFYFDPNKIQASDWLRLGLKGRLAQTIRHYIEKGGRFQRPEDLKKMYGLHIDDYDRLSPFIRITAPEVKQKPGQRFQFQKRYTVPPVDSSFHKDFGLFNRSERPAKSFVVTDINAADSVDWARLPGIGVKLASRIIHFREKLGGFYQTDQVAETFGLPDSTFQKIKQYLRVHDISVKQIDINVAPKEVLISHPYIRWQLARGILEYRLQHGSFQSVDELLQLAQMDPSKFERLKPYIVAGH